MLSERTAFSFKRTDKPLRTEQISFEKYDINENSVYDENDRYFFEAVEVRMAFCYRLTKIMAIIIVLSIISMMCVYFPIFSPYRSQDQIDQQTG